MPLAVGGSVLMAQSMQAGGAPITELARQGPGWWGGDTPDSKGTKTTDFFSDCQVLLKSVNITPTLCKVNMENRIIFFIPD